MELVYAFLLLLAGIIIGWISIEQVSGYMLVAACCCVVGFVVMSVDYYNKEDNFKQTVDRIELPEEIGLARKGDTLCIEHQGNITIIEFYHHYPEQADKQKVIVK